MIGLVLGFLLFSLAGWLRLYLSILDWQLLASFGAFPGPLYLAVSGLIPGLYGVVAAAGLWLGQPWAPPAARIGTLAAAIWYWLDRLFFARSDLSWTNWPFWAGVTVVCLLLVFLILSAPPQRRFFQASLESTQNTAGERKGNDEQE